MLENAVAEEVWRELASTNTVTALLSLLQSDDDETREAALGLCRKLAFEGGTTLSFETTTDRARARFLPRLRWMGMIGTFGPEFVSHGLVQHCARFLTTAGASERTVQLAAEVILILVQQGRPALLCDCGVAELNHEWGWGGRSTARGGV